MMSIPPVFKTLPHAVLLDLDNTFYAYDPTHAAALDAVRIKAMRIFGIQAAQFDAAFDQARADIKARLGKTASAHSRLLYFQRMLEMIGLGTQVMLALDFEQTYWRSFLANAELFPGAREFLDDLRLLNIPAALVTNLTSQIQFRKILFFGLDGYVSCIVTSEEAGHDKPHPAVFTLALEKLNPAGNCIWMVGDEPEADIGGGRQAGALTLQKLHTGVTPGNGTNAPDLAFKDFSTLSQLLKALTPKTE